MSPCMDACPDGIQFEPTIRASAGSGPSGKAETFLSDIGTGTRPMALIPVL